MTKYLVIFFFLPIFYTRNLFHCEGKLLFPGILFQEFVNIALNWLNTKLLTISEKCHKKYISSKLRFPNKTVYLLSKLFRNSTKISSISTKIE